MRSKPKYGVTAGSGTAGSPEQSASGVIAPANQDR
jgi:hypothetical protein